jgi:hypothetical protein
LEKLRVSSNRSMDQYQIVSNCPLLAFSESQFVREVVPEMNDIWESLVDAHE